MTTRGMSKWAQELTRELALGVDINCTDSRQERIDCTNGNPPAITLSIFYKSHKFMLWILSMSPPTSGRLISREILEVKISIKTSLEMRRVSTSEGVKGVTVHDGGCMVHVLGPFGLQLLLHPLQVPMVHIQQAWTGVELCGWGLNLLIASPP